MNITKTGIIALTCLGLIVGVASSIGLQSYAATTNPIITTVDNTASPTSSDTPIAAAAATPTVDQPRTQSHAPLGGDGNVTAINGNTITMAEEANEGGASYTVDASGATVTNKGAQVTLADIKVGDKIFVQGTTNGNSVTATSISLGGGKGHSALGGDGNITAINGNTITIQEETNEGGASYVVDASNATITNNGASSNIANLKIGDKIFVQGAVTGNNVAATSISLGGHGYWKNK